METGVWSGRRWSRRGEAKLGHENSCYRGIVEDSRDSCSAVARAVGRSVYEKSPFRLRYYSS